MAYGLITGRSLIPNTKLVLFIMFHISDSVNLLCVCVCVGGGGGGGAEGEREGGLGVMVGGQEGHTRI